MIVDNGNRGYDISSGVMGDIVASVGALTDEMIVNDGNSRYGISSSKVKKFVACVDCVRVSGLAPKLLSCDAARHGKWCRVRGTLVAVHFHFTAHVTRFYRDDTCVH